MGALSVTPTTIKIRSREGTATRISHPQSVGMGYTACERFDQFLDGQTPSAKKWLPFGCAFRSRLNRAPFTAVFAPPHIAIRAENNVTNALIRIAPSTTRSQLRRIRLSAPGARAPQSPPRRPAVMLRRRPWFVQDGALRSHQHMPR